MIKKLTLETYLEPIAHRPIFLLGKPKTKAGFSPIDGKPEGWTEPERATTLDVALDRLKSDNRFSTVGISLAADEAYCNREGSEEGRVVILDIDGCVDKKNGHRLERWCEDITEDWNTFTEYSESGTGLHVVGISSVSPNGQWNTVDAPEGVPNHGTHSKPHWQCFHSGGMWVKLTGDSCFEDIDTIADASNQVAKLNSLHPAPTNNPPATHIAPPPSEPTPSIVGASPTDNWQGDVEAAFNLLYSIADVIGHSDWVETKAGHWKYPDASREHSAIIGEGGRLKVFSPNAGIPIEGTHDAFSCYVWLKHGGDRLAAFQQQSHLVDRGEGHGAEVVASWGDTPKTTGTKAGEIATDRFMAFGEILKACNVKRDEVRSTGWHTLGNADISENMEPPKLKPPLIDGIIRVGETLNVISAAKSGKTWMVLGIAVCLATGRKWLDTYSTRKSRVLMVDNELHPETFDDRLAKVCEGYGATNEALDSIDRVMLRGTSQNINHIVAELVKNPAAKEYDVVVVDAMYRTLAEKTSENDSGQMTKFYDLIDGLAGYLNAAIFIVHHASKGGQGNKSVTDVGSGAGAISRCPDGHLVIRSHTKENYDVLDCKGRSFPPLESQTCYFEFPVWRASCETPEVETNQRRKQDVAKQDGHIREIAGRFSNDDTFTHLDVKDFLGTYAEAAKKLIYLGVKGGFFEDLGKRVHPTRPSSQCLHFRVIPQIEK